METEQTNDNDHTNRTKTILASQQAGRLAHLVATYTPSAAETKTTFVLSSSSGPDRRRVAIGEQLHNQFGPSIVQDGETSGAGQTGGLRSSLISSQGRAKLRRDSLANYISHAFALSPKTNQLFGCILGVNLLMSVLNTILLSFVVKSLQFNERGLLSGKYLVPDTTSGDGNNNNNKENSLARSNAIQLDLPAFLSRDKSISVPQIRQRPSQDGHRPSQLLIESWPTAQQANEILLSSSSSTKRAGLELATVPSETSDKLAEISPNQDAPSESNYIALRDSGVEIATRLLVMNQLVKQTHSPPTSSSGARNSASQQQRNHQQARFHHQLVATPSMETKQRNRPQAMVSRRMLEFDAEQQSISLPLLSRFDLQAGDERAKSGSSQLLVGEQLNCGAELSGTLGRHFDVQSARDSNLSCQAEGALRLIARSGGLNLMAGERVLLSAPEVHFGAPKTSELYLLDGVQYLDAEPGQSAAAGGGGAGLEAFNLILVDGLLTGARDAHSAPASFPAELEP